MDSLNKIWKASKAAVLNTPEIELKVLEATSNEKWGPTGTQMKEIARATYSYNDFPLIMNTIWERMNDRVPVNWRHVYKSLLLLDYLLKNGTEQVINEARVHNGLLQSLTQYNYIEGSNDVGISIRERVKVVLDLIHDNKRLAEEREKAEQVRGKFEMAIGSEGSPYRGSGGGGSYGGSSGGYGGSSGGGSYGGSSGGRQSYESDYTSGGGRSAAGAGSGSGLGPAGSGFSSGSRVGGGRSAFNDSADDDWGEYPLRSGSSQAQQAQSQPQPQSQSQFQSHDSGAARPRAPSGGLGSTPSFQTPQAQAQPQPVIDLLGLSVPAATAPSVASIDFFGTPVAATPAAAPASNDAFASTSFFSQATPFTAAAAANPTPQPTPSLFAAQPAPTLTPSAPIDPSDPWKQGEKLVSLDNLGKGGFDLKPTPVGVNTSFASIPGSQYNSLKGLAPQPTPSSAPLSYGAPAGNFGNFGFPTATPQPAFNFGVAQPQPQPQPTFNFGNPVSPFGNFSANPPPANNQFNFGNSFH